MLIQMTRFVFILAGAIGGYQSAIDFGWPGVAVQKNLAIIIYMILGSAIGYVVGGVVGRRLTRTLEWIEESLQNVPITDLILGVGGLVTGLVLAFLVTLPFALIEISLLRLILTICTYALFGWLGMRLGASRRDDFRTLLHLEATGGRVERPGSAADKLLDTNIIIDGRIVDIVRTGFLDGRLVLPRFVLAELQLVADSEDDLKRARGRRGLEVLHALQTEFGPKIQIVEADYPHIWGVDAKLVRLALDSGATILTNDYNLNKVAQVEGVKVLNLNDLANAVKTVVLPGEEMAIKIIREGKEPGQGVGYLEDGTMVVVDGGQERVGQNVELRVTSVIQTPAGRMIFSKLKTAERA